MSVNPVFEFKTLPVSRTYLAPDTSEIRALPEFAGGGLCHCTLGPRKVSTPVKHKSVHEIWYCLSGTGEIWQSGVNGSDIKQFQTNDSFTIPAGNSFQFRNTGSVLLTILIVTLPKWPGPDEAVTVESGYWE